MTDLGSFNAMVRQWADRQPVKYRLSALAFGYPCNRKTHCFEQTLEWVSKRSRKRPGEGVSLATLNRHLKAFEASGVIRVERRRDGSRNKSSVYHVDFSRAIPAEVSLPSGNAEREAWLASLDIEPPEDVESEHDRSTSPDMCPACQQYRKPVAEGKMTVAEVLEIHKGLGA